MTKTQITLIKKYYPFYIGQELKYVGGLPGQPDIFHKLIGVFDNTVMVDIKDGWNYSVNYLFGKHELMLRDLKEITKKEEKKFQLLCHLEKEDLKFLKNKTSTAHLTTFKEWTDGVVFLLSRGFDLFGLIENGVAVKQKK